MEDEDSVSKQWVEPPYFPRTYCAFLSAEREVTQVQEISSSYHGELATEYVLSKERLFFTYWFQAKSFIGVEKNVV